MNPTASKGMQGTAEGNCSRQSAKTAIEWKIRRLREDADAWQALLDALPELEVNSALEVALWRVATNVR